ncbi:unnamed protein product [Paramecium pentaurelia]|uniref:Uncharacterized protein n=1 Tax=Paramecium pentaurelia TaxID=43138 RepID=A0A8S1W460_9CILI|nr:unnamed protein product [Paramecium pentaurelia]
MMYLYKPKQNLEIHQYFQFHYLINSQNRNNQIINYLVWYCHLQDNWNNKFQDVEKKFQIVNQVKIAYAIVGTYNKNDINYLNEKGYNILIAKINKLRQLLDMSDLQIDFKILEYLYLIQQIDNEYQINIRIYTIQVTKIEKIQLILQQ